MSLRRTLSGRIGAAVMAVLAAGVLTAAPQVERTAQAIIGMPLTPLSFAGVARRTARRSAYYGAAYGYGVYGAAPYAAAATAATIATLPGGCVRTYVGGFPTYGCGGVYYRPYYVGPNLMYSVVPGP
jgi:hypothetical protein